MSDKINQNFPTEKRGMINRYRCSNCNGKRDIILLDTGVTPFIIRCQHCNAIDSQSQVYKIDLPERRVWMAVSCNSAFFRPSIEWIAKEGNDDAWFQHCKNGGMALAAIDVALKSRVDIDFNGDKDKFLAELGAYYDVSKLCADKPPAGMAEVDGEDLPSEGGAWSC